MATIDTSIYNALLKPVRSIQDYRGDADAREMNALQLQGQRMQMSQAQQAMEQQNALRGYLQSGNVTPEGLMRVDPKMGMDLQKTQAQVAKDQASTAHSEAQTRKDQLAAAKSKIDMTLQVLSGARDQQSYAQGVQMLQANGIDVSTIPPQFDPAFVQTAAQQALSVKERLDALGAAEGRQITVRGQDLTAATARRGQDITVRGQNLTDARAREANAATGKGTYDPARGLIIDTRTGEARPATLDGKPIEAKGKDAALTEVQANATSFVSRMRDASSIIDPLEESGTSMGQPRTAAAQSLWTNWMASDEGQKYMQGVRNWVTANLRKESGAAIPDPELANEYRKWFPQFGDGKKVIEQKRQARKVAEEAMTIQAGPGAAKVGGILERGGSAAAGAKAAPTTDIEALLKKYGQ
jgi:hypothetical protein